MTSDLGEHDTKNVADLLPQAVDEPQVQDSIAYSIQRLVIQCGALLRHQLERKARNGSSRYNEAHVDRVMFEFQATSLQIEATIADEMTAFALERIGGVFANALKDGVEALEALVRGDVPGPAAPQTDPNVFLTHHPRREHVPDGHEVASLQPPTGQAQRRPEACGLGLGMPGPGGKVMEPVPVAEPESNHQDERRAHDNGGVYQGTVNLTIESGGDAGGVVNFINGLRQTRGVLLTQLMGDSRSASSIQMRLPAPIRLRDLLEKMDGVSQIVAHSPGEGDGPALTVRLSPVGRHG